MAIVPRRIGSSMAKGPAILRNMNWNAGASQHEGMRGYENGVPFLMKENGVVVKFSTFLKFATMAIATGLSSPALATTQIMWWHAMSGELGRQLEKLAAEFNASQSEYRVIPSYKGNYAETIAAAIFAFRSRGQ